MHNAHIDFDYEFSLEEITAGINDLCMCLSMLEFLFLEYKNNVIDSEQLSSVFKSLHMVSSFWYQKLVEIQINSFIKPFEAS